MSLGSCFRSWPANDSASRNRYSGGDTLIQLPFESLLAGQPGAAYRKCSWAIRPSSACRSPGPLCPPAAPCRPHLERQPGLLVERLTRPYFVQTASEAAEEPDRADIPARIADDEAHAVFQILWCGCCPWQI